MKRRHRTIGVTMGVVALAASALALLRPMLSPAPESVARVILKRFGPSVHPDLIPGNYRPLSAVKTPSGFWKVGLVRVAGSGPEHQVVVVPDSRVAESRLRTLLGNRSTAGDSAAGSR